MFGEDFHAHVLDHADFAGDDFARQAVGGNGLHQHAAGPRLGLEHLWAGSPAGRGSRRRRGPAGPAPTMAIFRLAFCAFSRTSGSWIVTS